MWYVKTEFCDEFKSLLHDINSGNSIVDTISKIKAAEDFCKQGKGVSFYNTRVVNKKLCMEIERFKSNAEYQEFLIDHVKEP